MDGRNDIPPTPPYTRDLSGAAAANPSAGLTSGFAAGAAPAPNTGLARGLFVPPRTNSQGGVAPPPAAKPRSFASKRPMAAAATAAQKKRKGDAVSRRGKKAAASPAAPPPPEAPENSQFVAPAAADAHMVFDEMPTSFNDEAYMSTMGVGSNNWSQTNEVDEDDHEYEVDEEGEGMVDAPKGRACNYTVEEDVLLCNTWLNVSMDATVGTDQTRDTYWLRMKEFFDTHNKSGIERTERSLRSRWSTINKDCQKWAAAMTAVDKINPSGTNDRDRLNIAQNLFRGEEKKTKKGKVKKGRAFVLPHCYEVLKDEEKWKKREPLEAAKKHNATIDLDDDDDEASSDGGKRSPTPNSVAYSKPKRPQGEKLAKEKKKKKGGDDEIKSAMEAIVKARKEANEERRVARSQESAAEERRVAAEERKVALEEKKLAMEEQARLLEWEKYLFFMDTSNFDERQKEYINLCRDQILVQKRLTGMGCMGGTGATMGGLGGMGATMGGMGATMGGMGTSMGAMGAMCGMGGMGAPMGGMGGLGATMGGMSFASLMGGMGAPTGGMGGLGASGVPHMPSHDAFGDSANTVRVSNDGEDKEEEEETDEETDEEEEEKEEEEDGA